MISYVEGKWQVVSYRPPPITKKVKKVKQYITDPYLYPIVKKRAHYRCEFCRSNKCLGVHHIDCNHDNMTLDNLVLLCVRCHFKLHNELRKLFK